MKRTHNSLDRLKELIPPPQQPYEAGSLNRREAIEKAFGMALPEGWYQFALEYGSGGFGTRDNPKFLDVSSPFSRGFRKRVKEWSEAYRSLKETMDERSFPYDVYPENPGLLSYGSGERRALFWLTEGLPDDWPIILLDPDDKFHRFDMDLADFLFRLLSGKVEGYGGHLDAAWFKANKESLIFTPDRPRRKRKPT